MDRLPSPSTQRNRPHRVARVLAGLALALALAPAGGLVPPLELGAQERRVRLHGAEEGLIPPVLALEQDSTGFLWAATRAGLFRHDGGRFRRWAPDAIPGGVGTLSVSLQGSAMAVDDEGRLLELLADRVVQHAGDPLPSPDHSAVMTFDRQDRLWIINREGRLAWREPAPPPGGEPPSPPSWNALPRGVLGGDTIRRIFPAPGGGVLVAGKRGVWQVEPGVEPRLLGEADRVVDIENTPDGHSIALSISGTPIRLGGGEAAPLDWGGSVPPARAVALAQRGDVLWVALDRYLVARHPDGRTEVLGALDGVESGGPLLVDREGSLWHGGFTTLAQYPEPTTVVWEERHGLPSNHTRFVRRSGNVIWTSTWQGTGFLAEEDGGWRAGTPEGWSSRSIPCRGGGDSLLFSTPTGIVRADGARSRVLFPGLVLPFLDCKPASRGGLWLASDLGLFHLPDDGRAPVPVRSFPLAEDGRWVHVVLEDRSGRLWVGSHEQVCHVRAADLLGDGDPGWTCEDLPAGSVHLTALVELPDGQIWGSSSIIGLVHHGGTGWEIPPQVDRLPTRSVLSLIPSPRGGIWVIGNGILQRVEVRGDDWAVLESPGAWHGLPSVGGSDLLEEGDGTLWIATSQGVIRVPGDVRAGTPSPPRMVLVEGRVDGEVVSLAHPLVLPPDQNRLELRFAALTFRDPSSVRYQVRLSPEDRWADTDGQPSFAWVDLPAGRHLPQVRASLDGVNWSREPAELSFQVQEAWYRTVWARGLLLVGALLVLFGLYRARLAFLLGLERQRTRIAMDLHDEMGSGLASIGILAGVLEGEPGNGSPPGGERARIAREVATTAGELGAALTDIVWSLDPQGATLEQLVARLAEHGDRLFPDGVRFDVHRPATWPPGPLPLPVLRGVLRVGLEALHNAARHASASAVALSILPGRVDGGWVMEVLDNGVGLAGQVRGRGRGLRSMKRRAEEIGGKVTWGTGPEGGTRVRFDFPLSGSPGGALHRAVRDLLGRPDRNGRRGTGSSGPA